MLPSFHYWRGDRLASQQGTYLLLHLMFTHTHTHTHPLSIGVADSIGDAGENRSPLCVNL